MPNINELESLIDYSENNQAKSLMEKGFKHIPEILWSSTIAYPFGDTIYSKTIKLKDGSYVFVNVK